MKRIFRCVQRQDYERVLAYAIFIDFAFQLGIGGGMPSFQLVHSDLLVFT